MLRRRQRRRRRRRRRRYNGDGVGDGIDVDDGDWEMTTVMSIAFVAIHDNYHGNGDRDGDDGYVHRALMATATPMASAMSTSKAMATFIAL